MPAVHHLLRRTDDADLEKVRDETIGSFTTIGVVAALVLTMEQMNERR